MRNYEIRSFKTSFVLHFEDNVKEVFSKNQRELLEQIVGEIPQLI